MIGGSGSVRVFVYAGVCDMRKQMNGLSVLVREELGRDPQGGDLFVFRNRRRDMVKVLFFDQGGYCLLAKRLEQDTFVIELAEEGVAVEVSERELAELLAGAQLVQKTARAT